MNNHKCCHHPFPRAFVFLTDWPSNRDASSCQLQWHNSGHCTERLCRLGVVRSRGAGSQPLDSWWRNPIGPQSGKCSLLFNCGEYVKDYTGRSFLQTQSEPRLILQIAQWPFAHFGVTDEFLYLFGLQWVNGVKVTVHNGGHLPFEAEIGSLLRSDPSMPCRITIAVNNTLTLETLPPGTIQHFSDVTK